MRIEQARYQPYEPQIEAGEIQHMSNEDVRALFLDDQSSLQWRYLAIEEAMARGICSSDEVLSVVSADPSDPEVSRFMLSVLEKGVYDDVLYYTMSRLSVEDLQELVHDVVKRHPERRADLFRYVPFFLMEKFLDKASNPKLHARNGFASLNIIDRAHRVQELTEEFQSPLQDLETARTYIEDALNAEPFLPQEVLMDYVVYFETVAPPVLFPYLDKLEQYKLISPERVNDLIHKWIVDEKKWRFSSDPQVKYAQLLFAKMPSDVDPEKLSESERNAFFQEQRVIGRKALRQTVMQIPALFRPRIAQIYGGREQMKQTLSEDSRFFLPSANIIGLTPEEFNKHVRNVERDHDALFFDQKMDDLFDLLAYAKQEGTLPEFEQIIFSYYLKVAKEYKDDSTEIRNIIAQVDRLKMVASESSCEDFLNRLTKITPAIWAVANPVYAIRSGRLRPEELVKVIGTAYYTSKELDKVLTAVGEEARGQDKVAALEAIHELIDNLLEHTPHVFFHEETFSLFLKYREKEEVYEHIAAMIGQPGEVPAFARVVYIRSELNIPNITKKVKEYFRPKDDEVLGIVKEHSYAFEEVRNFFGDRWLHGLIDRKFEDPILQEVLVKDRHTLQFALEKPSLRAKIKDALFDNVFPPELAFHIQELVLHHEDNKELRDFFYDDSDVFAGDSVSAFAERAVDEGQIDLLAGTWTKELRKSYAFYVYRQMKEAIRTNPALLTEKRITEVLREDQIETLFHQNELLVAFSNGADGERGYSEASKLSAKIRDRMRKLSPIQEAQDQPVQIDIYDAVLRNMEGGSWHIAPWQLQRLREIASAQQRAHGEQIRLPIENMHEKFVRLVDRISLLQHSKWGRRVIELCLDDADQATVDSLLEQLAFLVMHKEEHRLDEAFERYLLEDSPQLEVLHHWALDAMSDVASDRLGFEKRHDANPEHVNMHTIQAMMQYVPHAQREHTMREPATAFAGRVFDGSYAVFRDWGTTQQPITPEDRRAAFDQLKEQQLIPRNTTIEQYKTWISPIDEELELSVVYEIDSLSKDIQRVVESAIEDKHIHPDLFPEDYSAVQKELERLFVPLEQTKEKLKEIEREYKEIKKKPHQRTEEIPQEVLDRYQDLKAVSRTFFHDNKDKIFDMRIAIIMGKLTDLSNQELHKGGIMLEQSFIRFDKIFGAPGRPGLLQEAYADTYPEFMGDINRIKGMIQKVTSEGEGQRLFQGSVTDAVDLETHLFIGQRPTFSCQNFATGQNYNYGLLSILEDPQVRVMRVCDARGNVVGRCLMRLMSNESGDPAIFLERTYTAGGEEEYDEAMFFRAVGKAKQMGIPCYSSFTAEHCVGEKTSEKLYAHGSRSGYVYTDSGSGLAKGGVFEVSPPFHVSG